MFNQKKWLELISKGLKTISSIDPRSLALFRIGISIALILDLIQRIPFIQAFYTDQGILPRFAVLMNYANPARISIHAASGELWFQIVLFLIAFVFAIFLLLGYRSKLSSIVSWILLFSLHNRNELVLQGGDNLFHIVLFWSMFLPLSEVWSLDSIWFETKKASKKAISSVASLAFLVQVGIALFFAALLKTGNEWTTDLTASAIALRVNYLSTGFGRFLLQFPELLKTSTAALYYIEFFAPILLFIPYKNWIFRSIALPFVFLMLFSFGLGLHIYLFPWIFIVSYFTFIPAEFWDWLEKKFKPTEKLTFYYDEECSFCTSAACALDHKMHTVSGQSKADTKKLMLEQDSFIIEDETGKRYLKFDAILKVGATWPITKWLVPYFSKGFLFNLGTAGYEIIAKNRHKISDFIDWLKKPTGFKIPEYITQAIAAFLLVYIIIWNVGERLPEYKIPEPLDKIAWTLGLNQRWDMFAPHPMSVSGWFVIPGELGDGTKVDVFNKQVGIPNQDQTYNLPSDLDSQSWRKYFTDFLPDGNSKVQEYFAGYMCRRWNNDVSDKTPEKRLHTFEIFQIKRTATDKGYSEPTKVSLWSHRCY